MLKVLIRKGYRNLNTILRPHVSKKENNKYSEFQITAALDIQKVYKCRYTLNHT